MDIKEFVSETLSQVTEAIENNSSSLETGGRSVKELEKMNMFSLYSGWVTYVDFDIAVTESSSGEGGAKLQIAGVGGIGGEKRIGSETVSRVKFRVPIQFDPSLNKDDV